MLASPIGRYQTGTSALHRLDARVKAVCLVALVCSVFAVTTPLQLVAALAGTALLVATTRLGARTALASVRPLVPFVLIVAVFNLFMIRGGAVLFAAGPLEVTTLSAWRAFLYAARLLVALTIGSLLLLTTTPTALTDAFESLLSPLARLGAPVHEVAMVMSLALRFVPILADEAQSVMDAQAARGGSFEEGGALSRVRALAAVMVPVFAGALRHAQNLSRALDARCYEGGAARTHYHVRRIRPADLGFIAACAAWLAVCLAALPALGL